MSASVHSLRLACFGVLLACTPQRDTESDAAARFGVLFGGQLQQRTAIPFELDPLKQSLALEVTFKHPLTRNTVAHWELSKPGAPRGQYQLPAPEDRITEFGDETLTQGQQRLERQITLKPGDNLGRWNIRVTVDDRVLLDRPFSVYDPKTQGPKPSLNADAGLQH